MGNISSCKVLCNNRYYIDDKPYYVMNIGSNQSNTRTCLLSVSQQNCHDNWLQRALMHCACGEC